MKIILIISVVLLSATSLILLAMHIGTLKPFKSICVHAAIGIGLLVLINLLSRYTGIRIPVNIYSVILSGVLGAPAVCGILILNLLL